MLPPTPETVRRVPLRPGTDRDYVDAEEARHEERTFFRTWFVRHRPAHSELAVGRLADWAGGSRGVIGRGRGAFAGPVGGLAERSGTVAVPSQPGR